MTTINNRPFPSIQHTFEQKRAYFKIPEQYKEAALTLAKIQFERERTAEKFEYNKYKDDKYFTTMRNRIICDNCDKIASTYSDNNLNKLNEVHDTMLSELHRLEKFKTNSIRFDQVYNRSLER